MNESGRSRDAEGGAEPDWGWQPTNPSLVAGLASANQVLRREQQERFHAAYGERLLGCFRARGLDAEAAAEMLQAFIVEKFISPDPRESLAAKYLLRLGVEHLRQQRGLPPRRLGFRAYLRRAALNFFREQLRARRPRSLESEAAEIIAPEADAPHPEEIEHALDLLRTALENTRRQYEGRVHWKIFSHVALSVSTTGPTPSLLELGDLYGDEAALGRSLPPGAEPRAWRAKLVESRLTRVREYLRGQLRKLLREDSPDPVREDDDLSDGLRDLRYVLASHAASAMLPVGENKAANSACLSAAELQLATRNATSEPLAELDQDLESTWEQLLASPLATLGLAHATASPVESNLLDPTCEAWHTVGDLLATRQPSAALLRALKDAAKASRLIARLDGDIGPRVMQQACQVAYVASVAAAHLRLGEWITSFDAASFLSRLEQTLAMPGLDPGTRALLLEARSSLAPRANPLERDP